MPRVKKLDENFECKTHFSCKSFVLKLYILYTDCSGNGLFTSIQVLSVQPFKDGRRFHKIKQVTVSGYGAQNGYEQFALQGHSLFPCGSHIFPI